MFTSNLMSTGDAIDIQLTGQDVGKLRTVADQLKLRLREYPGVLDIADSYRSGQQERRLEISPEAESLGLTRADLARQVRQGFYGEEAQRIQRGRDEVRVMVRYPREERRSLGDVENMRVRLPDGAEVPFSVVANVDQGRGDAVIQRADRRRSLDVTADVDLTRNDPNLILADIEANVLPQLLKENPGIGYTLEGEQREQADTVGGMIRGFALALVMIYALLAIPFRSYTQPVIVMLAIPFGIVGAIWGHMMMGMDLTIMSMFGVVALTGVLVNDSLVMVDFINNRRREGKSALEAVVTAGPARFRAILLTSLTTFAGLLPLLLERSLQAKFLIPMAVSLGFGVLFATAITLVIVPVAYMALEDGIRLIHKLFGRRPLHSETASV
jgi:multidrug efflux pump subunit AcrB